MIADFIRALRAAQIDLDSIQIAEAIFLATRMSATREAPKAGVAKENAADTAAADQPRAHKGDAPRSAGSGPEDSGGATRAEVKAPGPASTVRLYAAPAGTGGKVRVAGVAAFDRHSEFADALRPFARKRRTGATHVLDEEATVRLFAENYGRVLEPVYANDTERWFGLTLVVECVPSTELWGLALREFRRILRNYGAFSDVTSLQLHADKRDFVLTPWSDSLASRPPAALLKSAPRLEELGAAGDRRLVLVCSDCTSDSWHSGALPAALRKIAGRAPVALLNLLPDRLWQWTWVQAPEANVSTLTAGVPNARLDVVRPWWDLSAGGGGIALPVISFDPRSIANWARAVMAVGAASAPAVLLEAASTSAAACAPGAAPDPAHRANATRDAAATLDAFSSWATPVARQLAAYFSATSLTVPIMRLVQSAMLPQATTAHLAEVFLGGLLERAKTPPGAQISDDQVPYDFAPGVRARLQTWLSKSEARRVLQVVGQKLAARSGKEFSFEAFEGADSEIPEGMLPFAEVARALLPRLVDRDVEREAPPAPRPAADEAPSSRPADDTSVEVAQQLALVAASTIRSVKWSPDSRCLAIVHETGVALVDVSGPAAKSTELFELQSDEVMPQVNLLIFASEEDRADEGLARVLDLIELILGRVLFEGGRCRLVIHHEGDPSAFNTSPDEPTFAVIVASPRSTSFAEPLARSATSAKSPRLVSLGIWLGPESSLPPFYTALPVARWGELTASPRPTYAMRKAFADLGTSLGDLRDALLQPAAARFGRITPLPYWYCSAVAWIASDKLLWAHATRFVPDFPRFDAPYALHELQVARDEEKGLVAQSSTVEINHLAHAVVSLEAFGEGRFALSDSHGFLHSSEVAGELQIHPRRSGAGIPLRVFGSQHEPLWAYTNSGGGLTILQAEHRFHINLEEKTFIPDPIVDCFFTVSPSPEVILVFEHEVLEYELVQAGTDGSVPLRRRVELSAETPVHKAAISPDRRLAVFVSSHAVASLWDATQWRPLTSVILRSSAGDAPVTSVAFSPDSARVLLCMGSQVTVFGTDDLLEAATRTQRGTDEPPPMPLPNALDALNSFAMAFHLDRLRAHREEPEADYFEIEASVSADALRAVRSLCEWIFGSLIPDYLNGDPEVTGKMREASRDVIRSDTFGNFLRGFLELWRAYLGVIEARETNRRIEITLAVPESTLQHLQRLIPGIEAGHEIKGTRGIQLRDYIPNDGERRFTFSLELRDYFKAVRLLTPVVVQAVSAYEDLLSRAKTVSVYVRSMTELQDDRERLVRSLTDKNPSIEIRDLGERRRFETETPFFVRQTLIRSDLVVCLIGSTYSTRLEEDINFVSVRFRRAGSPGLLVCFKDPLSQSTSAPEDAEQPLLPADTLRKKLADEFFAWYRNDQELQELVQRRLDALVAQAAPAAP